MCGIAGIVGAAEGAAAEGVAGVRGRLAAMVAAQHHRGPDDQGLFVSGDGAVALGHNRLSILDLSPLGHQPMAGRDDASWIVFNGEIYNYLELRAALPGYPYRSRTDTEVILAAYERWGAACVERFVGMFAFALWDARRRRLFCARDRLGIKPFHYARQGTAWLFASEVKALLAAGLPAAPNLATWAAYLNSGFYDHGDDTFFAGVCTLPPGHTLTLTPGGSPVVRPYWDLPALAAEPLALSDDAAAERLRALLADAVALRLRSDVPLGVNLSGGLDSASMMVTADRLLQAEGAVQTFTASFEDPRYDELDFADDVPRLTRWARHLQRLPEGAVWDVTAEALWHQEAPFGGIATLAYHHLHRLAREAGVTVLLEGQGVDEMLAGYDYFRPHHYLDLLEAGQGAALRRALRADGPAAPRTLAAMRRLRRGLPLQVYQDGTSHLRPHCVLPAVRALDPGEEGFPRPFATRLSNALYRDLRFTKLPRVLRMNDRLSMAFSRELREPFLDHRLVEFLFRLPGHHKIRDGQSKYVLRHAMNGRLPDAVRLAAKRGVVTPQREWLRTTLRPTVEALIASPSFARRGLFDAAAVQEAYRRFCAGEGQNAFFVWQWVCTELWFRRFVDEAPAPPPRAAAAALALA